MSRRSHFPRRLIDTTTGWFRVLVMVVALALFRLSRTTPGASRDAETER